MPPTLFSQQFPFSYTEVLKTCWSFFFFLPSFVHSESSSFLFFFFFSLLDTFPDTVSNDSAGDKTGAPAWRLLFILSGLATASSQQAPSFQDERLEKKERLTSHAAFMLTRSRIPPSPYWALVSDNISLLEGPSSSWSGILGMIREGSGQLWTTTELPFVSLSPPRRRKDSFPACCSNWPQAHSLVWESPLSLSDDPADGWDELLWRQRHAELWTVHERRERTGSKSDSQPSDVEINTTHLDDYHSPQPPLSPCFLFPQLLPHPHPLSYLSLFGLETAQSVTWDLAFCPATSQTRGPLCCFLSCLSPSSPDSLPSLSPGPLLAPAP